MSDYRPRSPDLSTLEGDNDLELQIHPPPLYLHNLPSYGDAHAEPYASPTARSHPSYAPYPTPQPYFPAAGPHTPTSAHVLPIPTYPPPPFLHHRLSVSHAGAAVVPDSYAPFTAPPPRFPAASAAASAADLPQPSPRPLLIQGSVPREHGALARPKPQAPEHQKFHQPRDFAQAPRPAMQESRSPSSDTLVSEPPDAGEPPVLAPPQKDEDAPATPIDASPVKTKFPTARIKRIMQADEEVGKVAQQAPVAIGKALELFMISLVGKSVDIARDRGHKRISPHMLKQVIETDDRWDFLREIAGKIETEEKPRGRGRAAAASSSSAAGAAESDSNDEDWHESGRGRGGGRRKTED